VDQPTLVDEHVMEPSSLLGPAHPLVRVMRERETVARQALAVAMALAAAVTGYLNGIRWALPAAVGAAAVLALLGGVAIALRVRAQWAAREVIAEGGERLPLAPVEHERRRLLDERTRTSLAESLERLSRQATLRPARYAPPSPRPIFDVTVIAGVADDLRSTAAVLRAGPASARGVALTEQLLTWGGSALYGRGVDPLRAELGRVRYLLEQ
jgi:hypothetical protein